MVYRRSKKKKEGGHRLQDTEGGKSAQYSRQRKQDTISKG